MQPIRLLRGTCALAVATLASAMAATVPAPAQAAPTTATASPSATTTVAAPTTAGATRRAVGPAGRADTYWTASRMRAAIPADVPADIGSGAAVDGSTRRARGVPGSSAPSAAARPAAKLPAGAAAAMGERAAADLAVNASPTVGKVFFVKPSNGLGYVCSASTVNSGSRLLVITAGHCVHEGSGGGWMQNWTFVPLYNYGAQPYGSWSAKWLTTFDSWISDSNRDRDVGFVTVWPSALGRVVDVVGGNGLSWNYSYNQAVTILGYPAAAPYDGGWQQYCQGTTSRPGFWPFLENKIQLRCGFTGGSSGGPWLRLYDGNLGYVNGVMSTLNSSGMNKSSYFDDSVHNVFVSVADRT